MTDPVDSREYKVVINERLFNNVESGLRVLLRDMGRAARATGLILNKEFDAADPTRRLIRFLDTRDDALKANDLLLRQRIRTDNRETEYTLKCRSPDYFIAATKNVSSAKRFRGKNKLEDDINSPFLSKLSSSTKTAAVGKDLAGENFPKSLGAAGRIFPGVLGLTRQGKKLVPATKLGPVRNRQVLEVLFEGPQLELPGQGSIGPVAVILWTRGEHGRILIAELSFRHEKIKKKRMGEIAPVVKRFFEELQNQTWARPGAIGKTEFMYHL